VAIIEDFSRFADVFGDALLLVTAGGEIRGSNSASIRLLRDAITGSAEHLTRIVADPEEKVSEFLRLCARSREKLPSTLNFIVNGAPRAYHCDGWSTALKDEAGASLILLRLVPKAQSVQRFAALNRQIEQLKREIGKRLLAEHTAEERRELLRVTLQSIGDAVITTDVRGCVTFMNPIAERLTGWSQDEANGEPLDGIFVIRNEASGLPVESPVERVLRDGQVVGLANHTVLIAKDGTAVPIDDSGAPIRDESGDLIGVVLVFHEIGERRRLERQLEQQAEALREADHRKNRFLAMLGHELRNPLAPLRNAVQILRLRGDRPEVVERMTGLMERQIAQLTRLVDDLLDLARITRGAIELRRSPVSLQAVIDHALETTEPVIADKGHSLSVTVPHDELVVDGDIARLSQVFCNLLTNAAKFMDPGGEISVLAEARAGRGIVVVEDRGRGMDPAFASQVFDLFSQEDRSLDRREGGLGIGLTLVRSIVEMHGGEVEAASDGAGRGSRFRVSLPLSSAATCSAEARTQAQAGSIGASVLIVDDNVDAAESLALLLDFWGCATRIAHDGESAVEAARRERPDVILLDIGLPGMNGYKVAARLREMESTRGVRIVALTGYGGEPERRLSAEAGFDDHLTKPVELETLRRLLER
jgi:PAS domain S-box-containing protein